MYGMMLSSIVLVWFLYLKQTQLHVLRVVIIVYGLLISDWEANDFSFSPLPLLPHFPSPSYLPSLLTHLSPPPLTTSPSLTSPLSRAATIQDLSWENARAVLVGNKSDLDSRVVSEEQCQDLSQSLGFQFFETSAKEGTNVKETFEYLVDAISEKMAESIEKNPNFLPRGTRPRTLDPLAKSSGGCSC